MLYSYYHLPMWKEIGRAIDMTQESRVEENQMVQEPSLSAGIPDQVLTDEPASLFAISKARSPSIMPEIRLNFQIIDVFTKTRYIGNPLAIVHVPSSQSAILTQEQKQLVAQEFNLSETVFMHDNPPNASPDTPVKVDIFTTEEELPFAGHPTVGSSWYLLTKSGQKRNEVTLKIKAGDIHAVLQDSGRVRLQVPVDFKVHDGIELSWLKSTQPEVQVTDYASGAEGKEAVASIVKGMTFVLVRLNSEDALRRLKGYTKRIEVPWLGEWQGLTLEDPATGSAASTLAGWLAKRRGPGSWKFEIVQGVEMGRRSDIEVQVGVGQDGEVKKVELGGEAVEVMEGSIVV
ncbi:hypothetical protein NP233_g2402 [Leucocoprinus birnbaumii]|uniref:Phenazine biosynthesis protein n=1 Tax=Leucocoprinus birnbaumii TaxID=56174 RepID=A0AAD5W2C8_9AGAR|nr:hypothetical protein NP233_g2402 [Leucocoprinus birnbaumii]